MFDSRSVPESGTDNRVYIGVDIGATKTLVVLASTDGRIEAITRLPTRDTAEDHIEALRSTIQRLVPDSTHIRGIGVCCPGPVNPKTRTVVTPPNIPRWRHFPLGDVLEEHYRCPVVLENDADAAGLAEYHYGAGSGTDLMVYLTVSSGVGSAIIRKGEIIRGVNGAHPELGHHVVDPHGRVCSCGCIGCLEAYTSGLSIEKRFGVPPEELKDGDAWQDVGFWLGVGLGNIAATVTPEVVVVGGGVASVGELILAPARAYLNEHIHMFPVPKVVLAELGPLVGGIGALALIMGTSVPLEIPDSFECLNEESIV